MTPVQAAIYRFVSLLLVTGVAVAIVLFVPDPTFKTLGVGLGAAAVLALEEYLKNATA